MEVIVGVASVSANLSWRGNTQDRQSGNRKWNTRTTTLKIDFSLNGKPRTHGKFIGASDLFAGTGRAPRRRRTKKLEKASRSAMLSKCSARLSRPPTLGYHVLNGIIFLLNAPMGLLHWVIDCIVGVASVSANLSWRGNTQDRQSGNRKWNQLPA